MCRDAAGPRLASTSGKGTLGSVVTWALAILLASSPGRAQSTPARGPLRILNTNLRYFTDGPGHAIYLTGLHTWANLLDIGLSDPPAVSTSLPIWIF
jgi:hypothetical protein